MKLKNAELQGANLMEADLSKICSLSNEPFKLIRAELQGAELQDLLPITKEWDAAFNHDSEE